MIETIWFCLPVPTRIFFTAVGLLGSFAYLVASLIHWFDKKKCRLWTWPMMGALATISIYSLYHVIRCIGEL
jgi:hypothetical protein